MTNAAEHWEGVYGRKKTDQVSWFRPHLEQSLSYVARAQLAPDAAIIDVGAGASTFVDDLLGAGHSRITAMDLSATALDIARARLGERGAGVNWLVGDITQLELPAHAFDFWHDRAVFHFLREPEERARYVAAVRRALKPGGHIVVATFGPHGPERCSELDTMRYSADQLHGQFGAEFQKVHELVELHPTPSGKEQEFVYCYCRLR
ncbi:MAG: class I SAM-dependent methyltransferase [Archangium sp.]|nr:class I SAM-dependent methyltransferase [Archangium sp.]MDP3573023.1 class I SAM-dependent methyltransferase [Archangium sp.]